MAEKRKLLLLSNEPETLGAVAAVLDVDGRFGLGPICHTLHDLQLQIQREPVKAVLIDIDTEPEQTLRDLEQVIEKLPDTRFIVLAKELRGEWVLAAMKAGARHFLVKKSISPELVEVLERMMPTEGESSQAQGVITTVLSTSGGCGATTLAINLANEFHLVSHMPSLLVDLDVNYGAVSLYLGLNGQYGIADILSHKQNIDRQLIRSTMLTHSEGLRVLVSPVSVNPSAPLPMDFENLDLALESCKKVCPYTVIDAPRVPIHVAAELALHSRLTLLVLQLNVRDVRVAQTMLQSLISHGVSADVVLPVATRFHSKKEMVSLDDAQRAIGIGRMVAIRNDYPTAIQAMNYGQVLSQVAPKSTLRADIQELAVQIHKASPANFPAAMAVI